MNEEMTKKRKQNMKIYSLYRSISIDLIFYYATEFLFLTQVKQISASDIVLSSAFYAIFMILFQMPASILIDKIGTRKCTILANVFNAIFLILILFCENLGMLIFAQFISAICFSLKDISDKALIQYSIPKTDKHGEIFSKLEGKGCKNYYLINATMNIASRIFIFSKSLYSHHRKLMFYFISHLYVIGICGNRRVKRRKANNEKL